MTLQVAVSYGGREEIVRATRALAAQAAAGQLDPDDIDEERFARHLYTAGQPDPDLVIRTSGEVRISNFLLWQLAYARSGSPTCSGPTSEEPHLLEAFGSFAQRERRFGMTGDQLASDCRSPDMSLLEEMLGVRQGFGRPEVPPPIALTIAGQRQRRRRWRPGRPEGLRRPARPRHQRAHAGHRPEHPGRRPRPHDPRARRARPAHRRHRGPDPGGGQDRRAGLRGHDRHAARVARGPPHRLGWSSTR